MRNIITKNTLAKTARKALTAWIESRSNDIQISELVATHDYWDHLQSETPFAEDFGMDESWNESQSFQDFCLAEWYTALENALDEMIAESMEES